MIAKTELQQAFKAYVAKNGSHAAKKILKERFQVETLSQLSRSAYADALAAFEGNRTKSFARAAPQSTPLAEDRRQEEWAGRSKAAFKSFNGGGKGTT